jgi:transposase
MRSVALDLGTKKSTYCEVAKGQVVQRTTVSQVSSLDGLLGPDQPAARVAIEACREAWYVHDLLTEWGNQVVLVDTTRSRQLGIGAHGRKTDRLDAEALARALDRGGIPAAHVLSPSRREFRNVLGVRRCLVETRTSMINTIRGLAREKGCVVPDCRTKGFVVKARAAFSNHPELQQLTSTLLVPLETLETQIAEIEERLAQCCAQEPVVERLTTVPGVGSIVAAAFVSVVDDAGRFRSAHHLESYLGLVPSEDSSGGKRRLGAITKKGNPYVRALLVQSSWVILRKAPKDDPLRLWCTQVAQRRSKRIAVVALARRLVGVLWALWRDGTVYDPPHLAQQGTRGHRGAIQSTERKIEALQAARKKDSVLIPRNCAAKVTGARPKPPTRLAQLARSN